MVKKSKLKIEVEKNDKTDSELAKRVDEINSNIDIEMIERFDVEDGDM